MYHFYFVKIKGRIFLSIIEEFKLKSKLDFYKRKKYETKFVKTSKEI